MITAFRKYLLFVLTALMLTSCAVQRSPQGGDRDKEPPKILASEPLNESVNFNDNQIVMEFDEYVVLQGASKELIISPPLKYPVEFKQRKKKLFISWKDTLQENTTYLFQFGKGIVDLNENNPLDSNVFVFSTGPYLDSFEISGNIINAFDRKAEPDIWVMLYEEDNDSLPYKEIPRYIGKTDSKGDFQIKYMQPKEYKLFALKPINAGYTYDVTGEGIGFADGMIEAAAPEIRDTTETQDSTAMEYQRSLEIRMFIEDDSTQYVKSFAQIKNQGLILEFNRPLDSLTLAELTGNEDVKTWTENWSTDRDSVTYWFQAKNDYDSLKLVMESENFIDTIFFRKPKEIASGRRAKDSEKERLTLTNSLSGKQPHFSPWHVRSETPIVQIGPLDSFVFTENKDTVDFKPYFQQTFYGFTLGYPWKQDASYSLLIPDSSIFDRFGYTNDSLKFSFSASRNEDYGQLVIKYQLDDVDHPFLWELLTADGKLVDRRSVDPIGQIAYEHLKTGKYQIKITYDENGNGKWDTGYYRGKRQPERVRFHDEQIEIRSNWASEIEWILED
ncbi:MAG: Ig-like domain-containing protein [Flavobacteriales bacterium]